MSRFLGRQFRGVYQTIASASVVSDVASIAQAAQGSVAVTVPGVALDGTWHVLSVGASANPGAVGITAHVTGANTVTIYLQNNSGGAVDPASMTYTVVVGKLDPQILL